MVWFKLKHPAKIEKVIIKDPADLNEAIEKGIYNCFNIFIHADCAHARMQMFRKREKHMKIVRIWVNCPVCRKETRVQFSDKKTKLEVTEEIFECYNCESNISGKCIWKEYRRRQRKVYPCMHGGP